MGRQADKTGDTNDVQCTYAHKSHYHQSLEFMYIFYHVKSIISLTVNCNECQHWCLQDEANMFQLEAYEVYV